MSRTIRHHQWTNNERLDLLKICSDDSIGKDWEKRAAEMSNKYSVSQLGYVFTAKSCHAEMERILSSPCPGIQPNTSGQYSFSHKYIMEKWIEYYTKQIDEEKTRNAELAMVNMRYYTSLIIKLLENKMSLEEMKRLAEKLIMEDPKKDRDQQFRRVVSTYSNRLLHIWKEGEILKLEPDCQLSPTKKMEDLSSEGFLTPSNSHPSSTLSSPIRSVAEALKDAVPIFVEPTPPSQKMDEKTENEDVEAISIKEDSKEDVTSETPKQRGRPRLTTPKFNKTGNSETPEGTRVKRLSEGWDGSRKPRSVGGGGTAQLKPRKKENNDDKGSVRSASFDSPSSRSTPISSEWREIACQTDITIRSLNRPATPTERRKSVCHQTGPTTPSRKSSRKSDVVNVSTPTAAKLGHVGCQTGKVDFDKDDVLTLNYDPNDTYFVDTINLDRKKKERTMGEETMAEIEAERDNSDLEENVRRGNKTDVKKEIYYSVDTDDGIAKQLINELGFKLDFGTSSGGDSGAMNEFAKRGRKDEKSREETTTVKFQLNNMWRALSDHKHSRTFSHPVPEKEAPGYSSVIKMRMDLSTLKKEIDSGVVTTKCGFMMKAYTMFANAVMYNSTDHEVNGYARTMVKEVMHDILSQCHDERKPGPTRRSKLHDDVKASPRGVSLEPEPHQNLGIPGTVRSVFSRRQGAKFIKKNKI